MSHEDSDEPMPPHPIVNAMLVCDKATREDRTGKITLHGIFEAIHAPGFPAQHPQLSVYAKLTGAEGKYQLRLALIQLETATRIGSAEVGMTAPSRMGSVELTFNLLNIIFPEAGLYEFQLHANERYVGSKTISVVKSNPPRGGS